MPESRHVHLALSPLSPQPWLARSSPATRTKTIVGHGTKKIEKKAKGIPETIHLLDSRVLPFNDCR